MNIRHAKSSTRGSLAVLAIAGLVLAGCGSETDPAEPGGGEDTSPSQSAPPEGPTETPDGPTEGSPDATNPDPETTEEPVPMPLDPDELPLSDVPDDVVAKDEVQTAVADLAQRLDVETGAVIVAGYAAVTWNDGSIGCPEPGMMYTQAIVPGYQLILESEGQYFSYHATEDEQFSYCADPVMPSYDDRM